jgi:hypothetical protein
MVQGRSLKIPAGKSMKRKSGLYFFRAALFFLFFIPAALLFPGGAKEEAAAEFQDTTWTLVVAAFDTSALGEANSALGETILWDLTKNIGKVNYRLRVADDYVYYKSLALRKNLSTAAQALANKRNERDQLLYRGDPEWRYRKALKGIDTEIEKLEADYRKVLAADVLIDREPVFMLAKENMENLFPQPPKEGEEYRFCRAQGADAVITGTMVEYYGRIIVTQNLYVRYTDSYIYRDSIIFSPEDSEAAMEEFADGITRTIGGLPPAELRVAAMPENALVLLDQGYGGRGTLEQSLSPGKVRVEAFADDHESADIELELEGGEQTELVLELKPVERSQLTVDVPGKEGVAVYLGSLYIGSTPLALHLPENRLEYVFVESPDGEEAAAIFLSPPPQYLPPPVISPQKPRLLAGFFGPKSDLEGNRLNLRTAPPYDPEARRVDKTRSWYYWAWAGTWVSAMGAWMLNGYANSIIDSYRRSSPRTTAMYEKAEQAQIFNYAGIGLVSAAVLVEIIQMARYITTAGKDAPPYVD